jgi:NAD(P)-dependent dehydrogenase (short-subunit alcohol dehydrogenase family)
MTQRRIILVTGAASGIGAAVCRALAAPGTAVILHTRRNRESAQAVLQQVRASGADAELILGDLTEPAAATAVVEAAVSRFGGLDVLVSNAGFADRTPAEALSDAAMTTSIEAIAGAFLRLSREAMPVLRRAEHGRLIAVSSFVAHSFRPDVTLFPASAAAKAALEALVRALAVELGPSGVTVNAVAPGFIRKDSGAHRALALGALAEQTARIPLRRIGLPDDVAAVIGFLASPAAGYVTGQVIHVNGGLVI